VLYEKNGVITEERFKKLTQAQWWFHHKEIMKGKERQINETTEILKIATTLFNSLMDKLDQVGFMTNPELGSKLYEEKEKIRRAENGEPKPEDDMEALLESIKNETPETISVNRDDLDTRSKFILPKIKRKAGIKINEKKAGD
jgi:hypothetical protein